MDFEAIAGTAAAPAVRESVAQDKQATQGQIPQETSENAAVGDAVVVDVDPNLAAVQRDVSTANQQALATTADDINTIPEAVIVDISAQASSGRQDDGTDDSAVADNSGEQLHQDPVAAQNADAASVALSNAVDIEA